jgi:hypothetical protein
MADSGAVRMADEETGKAKRSMKPKPGVIDLEATELEREAPPKEELAEPPPAEDPPPSADMPLDDPDLSEAEPRSPLGTLIGAGVAGAAIAISLFVLLLALGLIPVGSGSDPALGNRIAELENRLTAAQEARPVPADNGALRSEIAALRQDIEKLRAAPAPSPDAALASRVSELAARVNALPPPSDTASVDQLKIRLDEVAAQVSAAREPDPAASEALKLSKSAASLAAFALVESAVARGAPYKDALANLKRLLPDADLAALEAGAEKGLPAATVLARQYERALEGAAPPETPATGLADRLAEGARSLVRIRPAAGSPDADKIDPADPWSARNVIVTRLREGDYAGALADRSKLDAVAQKATEEAAARLTARLEADTALDRLRADISARAEVKP